MSRKRQIYKASELRNLQKDENSCVSIVSITRRLAIPPSFLNDMKSGIFYFLKSILKKYDRELDGILLGYQNVKVLFDENTGIVQMGKAETEVNVSVEFFIFQPKIGSCLEGIVNKKSNNHISCLVHKYFNATILKPEDVEYEEWICKDFEINDKITFRVKDLDFTRLLPYIEGIVDKDLLAKCQINKKNKIYFNSENETDVSTSEKEKNQSEQLNKEESSFVNNNDGEKTDETDGVVKKKKKKKNSVNSFNEFNEQNSKEEELNVDISSSTEKCANEKVYKEKKKKRKKENRGEECENEAFDKTEPLLKEKMTVENNQEVELNDEHSKSDVKVKKKKKKDKKEKESVKSESKDGKSVNENSVEKGDLSFLYSTQIPSTTVSKLEMTFCSPIPREPTTATKKKNKKEKKKEKELFKTIISTSQVNSLGDEEKGLKKLEKRKRKEFGHSEEEMSSQQNENKSVNKDCDVSLEKKEDKKVPKTISNNSEMNDFVDKNKNVEKKDFSKVSEIKKNRESGQSEKESSLQQDEGIDVSPKKKIKIYECNETNEENTSKNISVEKFKPEINPTLGKNKSVDKDGESPNKSLTNTSPKKKGSKSVKESPKKSSPKSIDVKDDKPKSKVQSLLDELLQNQISKVKEQWKALERRNSESDKEVISGAKEHKKKLKDKRRSLQGEKESNKSEFLYEKLLKDAKSAVRSTQKAEENKSESSSDNKTLKPSNETGEKNIDSPMKKESSKVECSTEKKGKKRKRKESEVEEPQSKKFKNGSMYDYNESSPEKGVKEDKSLFSDSESNTTEKNIPRLNGHLSESEKEEKPKVENLLSDFLNQEKEKFKKSSETPRGEEEVERKPKSSKSGKKKKKSKEKTEESLYEKLLRDAKSLINSRSEEVPAVEIKVEKKVRTIDSYFKPA